MHMKRKDIEMTLGALERQEAEENECVEQIEEIRKKYLSEHTYITEEMECFISAKWGAYDYPGGEIISWEIHESDAYMICARMDDWKYGDTQYVKMRFINCKVIQSEYDMNIRTYEKSGEIHSNIVLGLGDSEIEAGKEKKCRINFCVKDEFEAHHNLILECDDVKLEYFEKWK